MEGVESVLFVSAGVEHGGRAGQLQESVDDALVLFQRLGGRFPDLLGLVVVLGGWLVVSTGGCGGREERGIEASNGFMCKHTVAETQQKVF
jgi:hypothetical protein